MTKFKHTPDSLADKLDQALSQGEPQQHTGESDPLVDAAMRVANAPKPRLSAEAKASILEQMNQHAPAPTIHHYNFQPLLRWAVAAAIILVLLLVPTAQVTLASVPGDVLYPAKKLIETIETTLATTPETQAALLVQHAQRRSDEAAVLFGRGQWNADLIRAAYENIGQAASIVSMKPGFDSNLKNTLQLQTLAINSAMNNLLIVASQPGQPLAATVAPLMTEIAPTQNSDMLLLPSTAAPSPALTETASPAFTDTATAVPATETTPTLAPSSTALPTATQLPTIVPPTPTATTIVNLIIEGPVEAINGNIVTIYGFDVTFDPNDPILLVLQIGDWILVNGNIAETIDNTVTITSVEAESADSNIAISEDGATIWRDSGNCGNPPPPWAPAHGWRARCENPGSSASNAGNNNPGNGNAGNNNPNNGNSPGNSGNNGNNGNNGNSSNNGKNGNNGNNGRGNGAANDDDD